MLRFVLALFVVVGLSSTGSAQAVETPADHDSLRKLKDSVVEAINRRDYATAKSVLHEPFMATVTPIPARSAPAAFRLPEDRCRNARRAAHAALRGRAIAICAPRRLRAR
jgi:hypothetical protein